MMKTNLIGKVVTLYFYEGTDLIYAEVEYRGKTKDGEYRFSSITYEWEYFVSADKLTVRRVSKGYEEKVYRTDISYAWVHLLINEDTKPVLNLHYIGRDGFLRPVYENGSCLFVDVEPRKNHEPEICTVYNNVFGGEPDTPIKNMKKYKDVEIAFFPKRDTW